MTSTTPSTPLNSIASDILSTMNSSSSKIIKRRQKIENIANERIPSWMALLSGAVAGTTVDVCLFPIDTLKTRMQSPQGFWRAGGFRGVYQGISAAATGSAPSAALFFLSYESFKPFIHHQVLHSQSDLNANPATHMIAASCGEVVACMIRVPTEIVKQRMQTGTYSRMTVALGDIWTRYRLKGFYVGYGTTVAREIPFALIQFPLWERFKILFGEYINDGTAVLPWQGACCGSVAGGIAAAFTTPLDVIKTRLMLQKDAEGVPYKGFSDVVRRLHGQHGYKVICLYFVVVYEISGFLLF